MLGLRGEPTALALADSETRSFLDVDRVAGLAGLAVAHDELPGDASVLQSPGSVTCGICRAGNQ